MDIAMPILNGVEATRRLIRQQLTISVVILSMYSDERSARPEAGVAPAG
jgi:DNA-binding NarL/FixJ family response regulator